MTNNKITYSLFNASGCLTEETMHAFLNNTLTTDNKKIVVSHLAECEFCKDAVEGLSMLESTERASIIVSGLNQRIDNKLKKRNTIGKQWAYISTAASVLLIVGMFFLYNNINIKENKNIADNFQEEPLKQVIEKDATEAKVTGKKYEEEIADEKEIIVESPKVFKALSETTVTNEPLEFASGISEKRKDNSIIPEPEKEVELIIENTDDDEYEEIIIDKVFDYEDSPVEESNELIISGRDKGDISNQAIGREGITKNSNSAGAISIATTEELSKKSKPGSSLKYSGRSKSSSEQAPVPILKEESKVVNRIESDIDEVGVNEKTDKLYFEVIEEEEEEEIFLVVEEMPRFQDGDKTNFRKYLQENVIYPQEAQNLKIEGTVYIQFIIDKTGKLKDAKVIRSVDPILDKEALRVVNSSPDWAPGKQRGENVAVRFSFPVKFSLD